MTFRSGRPVFALLLAFGSGACTLGPDYETPAPPSSPYASLPDTTGLLVGEEVDSEWWSRLGDPHLVELVEEARQANLELAQSAERVAQIGAALGISRGALLPSIGAEAGASRVNASETAGAFGPPPGLPTEQPVYEGRLVSRWELDLFGRLRRRAESARAQLQAAEWERRGVLLAVTASVVREYVGVRSLTERIAIAETNVQIAEQTAALAERLLQVELGSQSDVARARAELERLRSVVAPLHAERHAAAARLAVLLGREPGPAIPDLLARVGPRLELAPVSVDLPSTLLRRRPDVQAAERRLASEHALIGAEIADLFPRLSLSGAFGFTSLATDLLFDSESDAWSVGSLVEIPIFDGGRRRAQVRIARSRTLEALAGYRLAALRAFGEVEASLSRYASARVRVSSLDEAAAYQEEAFGYAQQRFTQGLGSALDVLDAQRELAALRDGAVSARAGALEALVDAHLALGGGW